MKNILLLGASGSIGTKTIDVVRQHPDRYKITGISVGWNVEFLRNYLKFHPELESVCVSEEDTSLVSEYPDIHFYFGEDGLRSIIQDGKYDLMVNALQGFVGLMPTLVSIENHIDIALANKETMVAAGDLVMKMARKKKVNIYPIDSEHSAIFQCLQGNSHKAIRKLIITASGGSFRHLTREQLKDVTLQQALAHPNWDMGHKITIDSATMMNKGFEVIEAHWLFDVPYDKIDTLLHKESVVHSFVEFIDHSLIAQLGVSDMRIPIQFSLSYPERITDESESLDLAALGTLHFEKMDYQRFPLLKLAYDAGKEGGNYPAIMNAANEEAVQLFLDGKIEFVDIENRIFSCMDKADYISAPNYDQILESDRWATEYVRNMKG